MFVFGKFAFNEICFGVLKLSFVTVKETVQIVFVYQSEMFLPFCGKTRAYSVLGGTECIN